MSVIVWDGKSIAADRMAVNGDLTRREQKLVQMGQFIYGFTGDVTKGRALIKWHQNGQYENEWPACQTEESWSRLIVIERIVPGMIKIGTYEEIPVYLPLHEEERFFAWGSGAHFAFGALEMGATARQAVEATCRRCTGCGFGVDEVVL